LDARLSLATKAKTPKRTGSRPASATRFTPSNVGSAGWQMKMSGAPSDAEPQRTRARPKGRPGRIRIAEGGRRDHAGLCPRRDRLWHGVSSRGRASLNRQDLDGYHQALIDLGNGNKEREVNLGRKRGFGSTAIGPNARPIFACDRTGRLWAVDSSYPASRETDRSLPWLGPNQVAASATTLYNRSVPLGGGAIDSRPREIGDHPTQCHLEWQSPPSGLSAIFCPMIA